MHSWKGYVAAQEMQKREPYAFVRAIARDTVRRSLRSSSRARRIFVLCFGETNRREVYGDVLRGLKYARR